MIKRYYDIKDYLTDDKVLIIYGARRVGKTTILKEFLSGSNLKYKLDSGDNIRTGQLLSSHDFSLIKEYCTGYELIAIDEAQNIQNIGLSLKIIIDNCPGVKVIATGSSSFELAQNVGEPLTGRKKTIVLYPFAQSELIDIYNKHELKEKLEDFLIFGSYPEVITSTNDKDKIEILNELFDSYLLKDIFAIEKIRAAKQLLDLLKLISFQVGNLVSLSELATQVKIDVKTVDRYFDLLEKSFVIKRVGGFSRNLRSEITSKAKYYFLDNGIRNAIVNNFSKLADRNDVGQLFENFIFSELIKKKSFKRETDDLRFWRTYQGNEVDFVEEKQGKLFAYEVKWSENAKIKTQPQWREQYKDAEISIINKTNYLDFLMI